MMLLSKKTLFEMGKLLYKKAKINKRYNDSLGFYGNILSCVKSIDAMIAEARK